MGVSPFIWGPVLVLGVLALLSVGGLGATGGEFGDITYSDTNPNTSFYYDANGNQLCWRNLTAVAGQEQGDVRYFQYVPYAYWHNSTNTYEMYNDNAGIEKTKMDQTWEASSTGGRGYTAALGTNLGLIAIISGLIVIGTVASVKAFGFGLSDVGINTILKGGVYILVWSIFSGLAMNLIIAAADYYTPIIYLALTGAYAFGCLGDVGTPSSG